MNRARIAAMRKKYLKRMAGKREKCTVNLLLVSHLAYICRFLLPSENRNQSAERALGWAMPNWWFCLSKFFCLITKYLIPINGSLPCHGKGACITQWSCESCHAGPPKMHSRSEEFWQNVVHWRRKWWPTPVFLPGEPHGSWTVPEYSLEGLILNETKL